MFRQIRASSFCEQYVHQFKLPTCRHSRQLRLICEYTARARDHPSCAVMLIALTSKTTSCWITSVSIISKDPNRWQPCYKRKSPFTEVRHSPVSLYEHEIELPVLGLITCVSNYTFHFPLRIDDINCTRAIIKLRNSQASRINFCRGDIGKNELQMMKCAEHEIRTGRGTWRWPRNNSEW